MTNDKITPKKIYAIITGDCRIPEGSEVLILRYIKSTNTYWVKKIDSGYLCEVKPQDLDIKGVYYE